MGANFINSCLEEFAIVLKKFLTTQDFCNGSAKSCDVIMSILSNYTPDCLVRAWVECPIKDIGNPEDFSTDRFVWKFQKAIEIAKADVYRATTHNKGIFNGIDAVVLATGNDFRAVEACGHTYASRNGRYESLTSLTLDNGMFHYELEVPISLGTVGGLTTLHPVSKISLELLNNPPATELMEIAAVAGLANNFGAIRSLVTKGIQIGHMKMHLLNILNSFSASEAEKELAVNYFAEKKVSYSAVNNYLKEIRESNQIINN
jgi:hydroxymethylglutaryl-CoA reductase